MKKIMFTSVIVAVLLAVCIVPGVSQEFEFPSKGQLNFIKSEKKWLVPMAKDKKAFVEAVKEGNIAKVKKIMSDFPAYPFLEFRIPVGKEICLYPVSSEVPMYPTCIAAINGRTELLKYMTTQLQADLSWYGCGELGRDLFEAALENNRLDTAEALIALNYKGFTPKLAVIAENIKDKTTLKRLIPLVLDTLAIGKVYNELHYFPMRDYESDALYRAADLGNVNFIIVLKDELKKRGINKPVAKYIGIVDAYNRDSFERLEESAKKSEAGLLLKRYGIDIYVGAQETWSALD